MARNNIKRRTAPPVASKMLPTLNPVTAPSPRKDPINPPKKAPAIPIRMVTMKPPGSLPGMMNFASKPTINPITIQDRIPNAHHPFQFVPNFSLPLIIHFTTRVKRRLHGSQIPSAESRAASFCGNARNPTTLL